MPLHPRGLRSDYWPPKPSVRTMDVQRISQAAAGMRLSIEGGKPLAGTLRAAGAKNAALPMMAAALLADEPIELGRVPRLADVRTMARLLRRLGVEVVRTGDRLRLSVVDPRPVKAPYWLVQQMRASFCVLGPLLARRRKAIVPLPGGCNLGDRPVDLHLKGLAALGAQLRLENGYVVASAPRLHGATVELTGPRGPTVTGTANVLCAAALARGTTTILGAAREPEIVDLGRLLLSMGARIKGLGTQRIIVRGVGQLGGATRRVIPDRIEAITLLLAAAITGGDVTLCGVIPRHLRAALELMDRAGMELEVGPRRVRAIGPRRPAPLRIEARPYPGLPTDVQAQFTALMCLAAGRSTICDHVFPARWQHAGELRRLGAQIRCWPRGLEVDGVPRLCGAELYATDLRASAALVLAGLAAQGQTIVHGAEHLKRGYERLDRKLARLGANIQCQDER